MRAWLCESCNVKCTPGGRSQASAHKNILRVPISLCWSGEGTPNKGHACMKPRRPAMTNAGNETAFRHYHLQAFPKSKHLLRSEVSWCDQTGVDLHLHMHRSTCSASWISTQQEPFPRSEFKPALNLDILDAGGSPSAHYPRSSPDRLITTVKLKKKKKW